MSNVLDETKQQQVIALGRPGWSLRRIEGATGVRRETVSGYLNVACVAVCDLTSTRVAVTVAGSGSDASADEPLCDRTLPKSAKNTAKDLPEAGLHQYRDVVPQGGDSLMPDFGGTTAAAKHSKSLFLHGLMHGQQFKEQRLAECCVALVFI